MKSSFFSLKTVLFLVVIGGVSVALMLVATVVLHKAPANQTEAVAIKSVSSQIQADGAITAQNQATLHFQTGGKVVYLPFKEGDTIRRGQTIASLDTTVLQKQLTQALNTYQNTRDTFDQAQANNGNNVLQGQQKVVANAAGVTGDSVNSIVDDAAKRILDQNQNNLNNSVLSVEIAQQAIQLATITSPLDGVVTHMDITTANVNVTPTTGFTVIDPTSMVFRANVSENDIDYVSEGSSVTVKLGDDQKGFSGAVSKIYPDKVTLPTGQKVYAVDIVSANITENSKLGQSGTVLIQSNDQTAAKLIPTWTVLNNNSVWVLAGDTPILRKITTGKVHGDMTEVVDGLADGDQLLVNPQSIAASKYQIL